MKIPVPVACVKCQRLLEAEVDSIKRKLSGVCTHCGADNGGPVDTTFHVGHALITYATSTLRKDPNLTILFSGMAVDSYLSHVYLKWRDLEELRSRKPYDPLQVRQDLYEELRKIRGFAEKAQLVLKLLYPQGIAQFFNANDGLRKEIEAGFPEIAVSDFVKHVEQEVLWKRNDVVHIGKILYSEAAARRSVRYARIFIRVFESMEAWRRTNSVPCTTGAPAVARQGERQ